MIPISSPPLSLHVNSTDIVCAGGEDSLSSTLADTHSPSHVRGPVGVDSETDNSHTEKRNSATGGDRGTAIVLFSPPLSLPLSFPNAHIIVLFRFITISS